MKKKLLTGILAISLAGALGVALAACGGDLTKVKNEEHWKEVFDTARTSDRVSFRGVIFESETGWNVAEFNIEAVGGVQHLKLEQKDAETWEYYYDGDYVYLNVAGQNLGYTWQKIEAESVKEEFGEPLSYIDLVYSGEFAQIEGLEWIPLNSLDELSQRYKDAEYGIGTSSQSYTITDAKVTYIVDTYLGNKQPELLVVAECDTAYIAYGMGNASLKVSIPTTSVQEAE